MQINIIRRIQRRFNGGGVWWEKVGHEARLSGIRVADRKLNATGTDPCIKQNEEKLSGGGAGTQSMNQYRVRFEPFFGGQIIWAKALDLLPKMIRMIHMFAVSQFMQDDVIPH